MSRKIFFASAMMIIVAAMIGCDAAIVSDGRYVGIRSGQIIYQDGYLRMNYRFPLDTVWQACEKTVADLKGTNIQKERKIASGTIKANVQDEKVTIITEYYSKDMTTVSILVGITGNNIASNLIHERIAANVSSLASAAR